MTRSSSHSGSGYCWYFYRCPESHAILVVSYEDPKKPHAKYLAKLAVEDISIEDTYENNKKLHASFPAKIALEKRPIEEIVDSTDEDAEELRVSFPTVLAIENLPIQELEPKKNFFRKITQQLAEKWGKIKFWIRRGIHGLIGLITK